MSDSSEYYPFGKRVNVEIVNFMNNFYSNSKKVSPILLFPPGLGVIFYKYIRYVSSMYNLTAIYIGEDDFKTIAVLRTEDLKKQYRNFFNYEHEDSEVFDPVQVHYQLSLSIFSSARKIARLSLGLPLAKSYQPSQDMQMLERMIIKKELEEQIIPSCSVTGLYYGGYANSAESATLFNYNEVSQGQTQENIMSSTSENYPFYSAHGLPLPQHQIVEEQPYLDNVQQTQVNHDCSLTGLYYGGYANSAESTLFNYNEVSQGQTQENIMTSTFEDYPFYSAHGLPLPQYQIVEEQPYLDNIQQTQFNHDELLPSFDFHESAEYAKFEEACGTAAAVDATEDHMPEALKLQDMGESEDYPFYSAHGLPLPQYQTVEEQPYLDNIQQTQVNYDELLPSFDFHESAEYAKFEEACGTAAAFDATEDYMAEALKLQDVGEPYEKEYRSIMYDTNNFISPCAQNDDLQHNEATNYNSSFTFPARETGLLASNLSNLSMDVGVEQRIPQFPRSFNSNSNDIICVLNRPVNAFPYVFSNWNDAIEINPTYKKEIAEYVKARPLVVLASENYSPYKELSIFAMEHIIEVYKFPASFYTNNILNIFREDPRYLKWCDDTHALLVTNSRNQAERALKINNRFIKTRPLTQGSPIAIVIACQYILKSPSDTNQFYNRNRNRKCNREFKGIS